MDFDDTPAEAEFRAEARSWLEGHAIPKGHPDDFSAGFYSLGLSAAEYVRRSRVWQGTLATHGWAGITWPTAVGGRGGTPMQSVIFNQEQSKFGVNNGIFAVGIGMAGPTLLAHGTDEQKARYLPRMLDGTELWCQLFSEPEAGSDLASLTTTAERDGDEFVVTGQKVWTSQAHEAELGILLVRTDWDVPKHAGLTFLVIDMSSPGIEIRPLRQLNGEAHFNEVFLDRVRVPVANAVGSVGDGWKVAMTTLASERSVIGGGSAKRGFADLVDLARARGLADDAAVRGDLARVHTNLELMRYLQFRTQTALSQGRRPGPETSVMKLFYVHHLKAMCELAVRLQGPSGSLAWPDAVDDGVWQQHFLNAVSQRIAGGSDEVQRNILGERVLGLPREPQVDRDGTFREARRALR